MARRSPPPQPQTRQLSRDEIRNGIKRLKSRIAEIEAFDVNAVQKRWPPEGQAIGAAIDKTLADTGLSALSLRRKLGQWPDYPVDGLVTAAC
jgi:hypothetical protein